MSQQSIIKITGKIKDFSTTTKSRINHGLGIWRKKRKKLLQKRREGKTQPVIEDNRRHICKNCKAQFTGKYCFNCGQAADTGRLRWSSVINNIFGGITNIASGFGFTIIELFTRPGYMINDFIHGKRVIYAKPFPMLFVLAAIFAVSNAIIYPNYASQKKETTEKVIEQSLRDSASIVAAKELRKAAQRDSIQKEAGVAANDKEDKEDKTNQSGQSKKKAQQTWDDETENDVIDDMISFKEKMVKSIGSYFKSPFVKYLIQMIYGWFSSNRALTTILFLPFITLGTKWAFRKSKYNPHFNYVEILFAQCYLSCQMLVVSILLLPFYREEETLHFFAGIILSLWAFKELFRNSKRGTIRRYIVSYIYAYGVIVLLAAIAICLLVLFVALFLS